MKYFLLIAGAGYYPKIGTSDWKETFETLEEAEASVSREGESFPYRYKFRDDYYDWYKIVDLRKWIKG